MTATRITVDGTTYRVLVEYDTLKRSFLRSPEDLFETL